MSRQKQFGTYTRDYLEFCFLWYTNYKVLIVFKKKTKAQINGEKNPYYNINIHYIQFNHTIYTFRVAPVRVTIVITISLDPTDSLIEHEYFIVLLVRISIRL